MSLEIGIPSSLFDSLLKKTKRSAGRLMLVFSYVACTAQLVAIGSNAWHCIFLKSFNGVFTYCVFLIDTLIDTESASENKMLHMVAFGITFKNMSANKLKVSVSLSPEMLEWLKSEADRETQETGEDVSVSRLVARAVKAMQGKAQPVAGAVIRPASANSVSGRSIPARKTSRKAG